MSTEDGALLAVGRPTGLSPDAGKPHDIAAGGLPREDEPPLAENAKSSRILFRSHGHHRLDRRGAASRGEAGEDRDQDGDRGAGDVGQGLQAAQRDAHVEANV